MNFHKCQFPFLYYAFHWTSGVWIPFGNIYQSVIWLGMYSGRMYNFYAFSLGVDGSWCICICDYDCAYVTCHIYLCAGSHLLAFFTPVNRRVEKKKNNKTQVSTLFDLKQPFQYWENLPLGSPLAMMDKRAKSQQLFVPFAPETSTEFQNFCTYGLGMGLKVKDLPPKFTLKMHIFYVILHYTFVFPTNKKLLRSKKKIFL